MNASPAWPTRALLVVMAVAIAVLGVIAYNLSTQVQRLDNELADVRAETESLQAALDAERARSEDSEVASLDQLAERLAPAVTQRLRDLGAEVGDASLGDITDQVRGLGQDLCDIPGNDWC